MKTSAQQNAHICPEMKQFFAANPQFNGKTEISDFFSIAPFFHLKKHNYFIVYFGVHKHFSVVYTKGGFFFVLEDRLENS